LVGILCGFHSPHQSRKTAKPYLRNSSYGGVSLKLGILAAELSEVNYMNIKGKQIADYVWLDKTQRSWHIWSGNPFCMRLHIVPLKALTEKQIIKSAQKGNEKEKKRFTKLFPSVKWVCLKVK